MTEIKKIGKRLAIVLGTFQLIVGAGGLIGGIPMILDPGGSPLGLTQEVLDNTPFTNFLIPGLVLLTLNGIFILVAGIASILKFRWAGEVGILFGIWLTGFMLVEIWWVGLVVWLQHFMLILGIAEIILGFILWKYRLLMRDA